MGKPVKYLLHRDGRYYARMVVPSELRKIVGTTELREPLGADRRTAETRLHRVISQFHDTLNAARKTRTDRPATQAAVSRSGRRMTAEGMARAHYAEALSEDTEARPHVTYEDVLSLRLITGGPYEDALRKIAAGGVADEFIAAHVGWIIDKFRERGNTVAAYGSLEWRQLARLMAGIELDIAKRLAELDQGREAGEPTHPALVSPPPAQGRLVSNRILNNRSTMALSELLADFKAEKQSSPATAYEYEVAVRMFEEFLGEARPVHLIGKQDVIDYKTALVRTPANYTKRFPGKTLPQAVKENAKRRVPFETLSSVTINDKWLPRLHSILSWCVNNNIIPDNPASKIKVDVAKGKREREPGRVPFTPEDLRAIFGEKFARTRRDLREREWAVLISLFTGMRAHEIAQLDLASVRNERGILCFVVEDRTKTASSRRVTPVHRHLIALGLEARIAALAQAGQTKLFPEWCKWEARRVKRATGRAVNHSYSQYYPRWFNRTHLPAVGVVDSRKVFHSFRHTLKTALARAGVPRSISDDITGHDDSSAGGIYVHDSAVEVMKEAIDKVSFDEAGLSRLFK